jgi:molybdopterin-guanine dinucleotide biosynthesis protein A
LFVPAEHGDCVALVPSTGVTVGPLCAIDHRRARVAAEAALVRKRFTMQEFVSSIESRIGPAPDPERLRILNTPEDGLKQMEALKP